MVSIFLILEVHLDPLRYKAKNAKASITKPKYQSKSDDILTEKQIHIVGENQSAVEVGQIWVLDGLWSWRDYSQR